jgi:hypothetical protein
MRGAAALLAIAVAATSAAAQTGPLRTLMPGRYDCERPGPPGSQLFERDADASFEVTSASRYIAGSGAIGTYLMTGGTIVMTSGPLAGTRLVRIRPAFLRRLEGDGSPGRVRCVLSRSSDTG